MSVAAAAATDIAYDAFISYSHDDLAWVRDTLVKALRKGNVRVHFDEDFDWGKSSFSNMAKGVRLSRCTVAVVTRSWLASDWGSYEVQMKLRSDPAGRFGRVIVIRREDCEVPDWLATLSWADFFDDAQVPALMERLIRMLLQPDSSGTLMSDRIVGGAAKVKDDPELHSQAKIAYRYHLEPIGPRTQVVSALKKVHDELDHIETHCHNEIVRNAPRLSTDADAVVAIGSYVNFLRKAIVRLRALENERAFANGGLTWIADLEKALATLNEASRTRDHRKAMSAAARLKENVLTHEPGRIDARLSHAAGELELRPAIDAIAELCKQVHDPATTRELQDALADLESLDDRVQELVRSHNLWQDVDLRLRRIASQIHDSLEDLLDEWPKLKQQVRVLASTVPLTAVELERMASDLDQAIATNQPASAIAPAFQLYLRCAQTTFSFVDMDLDTQCEELVRAGNALSGIVADIR